MHRKWEDIKKERSLPDRLREAAQLHSDTKDLLLEAANRIDYLTSKSRYGLDRLQTATETVMSKPCGPNHYSFHKDMWEEGK